jgi:predicted permease
MSTPDHTPVWPLFQTILGSIIQVILVCLSGYVLARRGIIDKSTQKQLNVINVNFFTPCLLFSKVAFFLSPAKLRELWIIPIFFLLVSGVSLAVAWFLGNLFRLRPSQRNFAMAAATFMNSNSLPVALLQSLAVTVPGLRWGEDDTKDAIIGRALTYLLLCSTIGQFLRWSYGVHLLSMSDPSEEEEIGHTTGLQDDATSTSEVANARTPNLRAPNRRQTVPVFYSFPSTPLLSAVNLHPNPETDSISDSGTSSEDDELLVPAWTRPAPTFLQRVGRSVRTIWKKVTNFLTPPLWASLISLAVALNQPLQHVLEVHLHPVQGAITQAGNCSIPVTLIVLGAYFHRPAEKKSESVPSSAHSWRRASLASSLREIFRLKDREEDKRSRVQQRVGKGEGRTIFVAIFARMIVVPALFLPFMAIGALRNHPPVFQDPVFILSNVLLLASPPALTLAQITQAVSSDTFERLISRTIFWSYCFVTPPAMVGYAMVAMLITKL